MSFKKTACVIALTCVLLVSGSVTAQEVMSVHLNPRANGIMGADGRVPIPWGNRASITKKVVRLLDTEGNLLCTGSVVGPTTILTAAHCVYWDGAWLQQGNGKPQLIETWDGTIFDIKESEIWSEYEGTALSGNRSTTTAQFEIDVALIRTNKPVSGVVGGFLGITKDGTGAPRSTDTPLTLLGFHGDVEFRRPKQLVMQQCYGSFRYTIPIVGLFELGRIAHYCDSTSGSSGSPLLSGGRGYFVENVNIHDDNSIEHYQIFGIHAAYGEIPWLYSVGEGGFGVHLGASSNEKLYDWLYDAIREDREAHGYRLEKTSWRYLNSPENEKYLTGVFQGPDDVEWLK